MAERARPRLPRVIVPAVEHPDALDETVVHDPQSRPWLVCTIDRFYWQDLTGVVPGARDGLGAMPDLLELHETGGAPERFETQVFYTARGGIRGFPTGWGDRYWERSEAISGHRRWCLFVRTGEVYPDLVPDRPL